MSTSLSKCLVLTEDSRGLVALLLELLLPILSRNQFLRQKMSQYGLPVASPHLKEISADRGHIEAMK